MIVRRAHLQVRPLSELAASASATTMGFYVALIAMMRSMAIELAPKVRVNAVNPGYTMTPMQIRFAKTLTLTLTIRRRV